MTVENTLKLLKSYQEKGNKKGYEMLLAHINNPRSRKYRGVVAKLAEPAKEEKEDEKPKRRTRSSVGDNKLDK